MTPSATTTARLQRYATDPAAFRADLLLDADDGPVRFANIMDDWQREDFAALDGAWLRAAGRSEAEPEKTRAYFERPRGHSKSTDLAVMSTWALAFAPRAIRGAAAAGDRDQARLLRDAIERIVRANPWLAETLEIQNYRIRNPRTGSALEILAADHATAYGHLLDFLVIDELTNWPTGGDKLWQALVSTIAKRRHCVAVIISNAGVGQGQSWQWDVRETCRDSPQWLFSRLDGPTASWITPELLAEQERLLPTPAYRRLWENKWTSGKGDLLTVQQLDAATTLESRQWTRDGAAAFYVAGLDLGWRKDRSALVILGCYEERGGCVRLVHCQDWDPRAYGGELPLKLVEDEILRLHSQFGFAICYDPREAVGMSQRLLERGVRMLRVATHARAQQNMVSHLLTAFTEGSVELYAHKGLRDDLLGLSVVERASGLKIVADRSDAGHSDMAIAFCYGLMLARLWLREWRTRAHEEIDEYIVL